MSSSYKTIIFFLSFVNSLWGVRYISWNGLYGNPDDGHVVITTILQKESEVYLEIPVGIFYDTTVELSTVPVPVEFPTLFVVDAVLSFNVPSRLGNGYFVIMDALSDIVGKYDWEMGNGWINHSSFGWLYIWEYPWVYSPKKKWRYVVEAGILNDVNSWFFYCFDKGWIWVTKDTYPWVYSYPLEEWIYDS